MKQELKKRDSESKREVTITDKTTLTYISTNRTLSIEVYSKNIT